MAEIIEGFAPRRGRPPKYPWAEWTDGRSWRVLEGVDFHVTPDGMARIVRNHARRHGLVVRAQLDLGAVEFQFERKAAA